MTEAEWLACDDAWSLLNFLRTTLRAPVRKMRLVFCAACRDVWDELTDPRYRRAVEVAELFADKLVGDDERAAAWDAVATNGASRSDPLRKATMLTVGRNMTAPNCLHYLSRPRAGHDANELRARTGVRDVVLIRDIFGNPFRPVSFDPAWRTDTAVALARTMYDSREFSAMPILADALQDAGCEDEQILTHCRDANQLHVRGCWVCDLVLNKT
jgi:hypothetical protein